MKLHLRRFLLSCSLLVTGLLTLAPAASGAVGDLPAGVKRVELQVDGTAREALIYTPESAKSKPTPLVFVFHGHGGTMRNAVRQFTMNTEWPEAISVYMQGLNTPGRLTDPEGKKPGWQIKAGDHNDRDLKFFDAILAQVKSEYKVDEKHVFCTGHSNGGAFTYLLWAERGDVFTAMAPSAAVAGVGREVSKLKPKPAMHLAGEKDPLVKFEWQQATMDAVRKLDGCDKDGKAWADKSLVYESKGGTPFVTFIHPGGHEFVKEAPALIAKFFKEHTK